MHFARARLTSHLEHGLAESLSLRLLGIGQKISTTEDTEGTENDLAPPCAPVPPVVKLSVRVAAPRREAKDPCILPALVSLLIWNTGSQNRSPCASWESVRRFQPQRTQRAQRNDLAPPCSPVPPVVKLSVRVLPPDAKRRTHAFCPRSSHFSFGTRARRIAFLAPPGNRSKDLNHRGHRGHREMI